MKCPSKKIAKMIKKASKIAFFYHIKPDWDTVSSSYALSLAIKQKFPQKEIKWIAKKEDFKNNLHFRKINLKKAFQKIDSSYTAIIGDTHDLKRITLKEEFIKASQKICFDHHLGKIDPQNYNFIWQDSSLPASTMQAFKIAKALKIKFNSNLAILFLAGILTDTGNLHYSLNDLRPVKIIAELFKYIDNKELKEFYKDLKIQTKQDLKIKSFILKNIKYQKEMAYIFIKQEDFKTLEVKDISIKKYVNVIGNIQNMKIWFMCKETKDNYIKCSLRSTNVNVNKIAQKFNGGGHLYASGLITKNNGQSFQKIIKEIKKNI